MIRSMTGYGRAHLEGESFAVTFEIRSVNNRFLKVSVRLPEVWDRLSRKIEQVVRERLSRGSVFVNVRKTGTVGGAREFLVNREAIEEYRRQLAEIEGGREVSLSELLSLPGAVGAADDTGEELEAIWERLSPLVDASIDELLGMRRREGEHLCEVMHAGVTKLRGHVARIREAAPAMVEQYRDRLAARVEELLRDSEVNVSHDDLARELAIYAERSDVREEIDRTESHLKQFEEMLDAEGAVGRQMEFLVQEMFREANTMGSKAADAAIARIVLDAKAEVDRLKEQVMNVE